MLCCMRICLRGAQFRLLTLPWGGSSCGVWGRWLRRVWLARRRRLSVRVMVRCSRYVVAAVGVAHFFILSTTKTVLRSCIGVMTVGLNGREGQHRFILTPECHERVDSVASC